MSKHVKIERKLGSALGMVFHRADGSVRMIDLRDHGAGIGASLYFLPGTRIWLCDAGELAPGVQFPADAEFAVIAGTGGQCWHWASAYTDEELAMPGPVFGFTPEEIRALRAEAAQADAEKRTVDKPRKSA